MRGVVHAALFSICRSRLAAEGHLQREYTGDLVQRIDSRVAGSCFNFP